MEKTLEKLGKFSEMVMQDAYRKKNERIRQAEKEKEELIASSELQYLQKAYEKIQEAVRKFDKEYNEEISKAIVESKEAMFNRRDEIVRSVFDNVRKRLQEFVRGKEYPNYIEESKEAMFNRRDEIVRSVFDNVRKRLQEFVRGKEYPNYIEERLKAAIREAGDGKLLVTVNEEDMALFSEIRTRLGADFELSESDEDIIGGFLITNRDKGLVWDYSFLSRLNRERADFLVRTGLSIE